MARIVPRAGDVSRVRQLRLRAEARAVRIESKAIHEVTALTVKQAREFSPRSRLPKTTNRSPIRWFLRLPRGSSFSTAWGWNT